MKRILITVLAIFSLFMLGACSNDNLDGSYYEYDREESYLRDDPDIVIEGTVGKRSNETFTVDTKEKEFSANGSILPYVYEDGVLTVNGETYVQKGTDAYNEAKKANSKRLQEIADKEKSKLEMVEKNLEGKFYAREKYSPYEISEDVAFEITGSKIKIYDLDGLDENEYEFKIEDLTHIKIADKNYSFSYDNDISSIEISGIRFKNGEKLSYTTEVEFVGEKEKGRIEFLKKELQGKFYEKQGEYNKTSEEPSFEIIGDKIKIYKLGDRTNREYDFAFANSKYFTFSKDVSGFYGIEYLFVYNKDNSILEMVERTSDGGKYEYGDVQKFLKK